MSKSSAIRLKISQVLRRFVGLCDIIMFACEMKTTKTANMRRIDGLVMMMVMIMVFGTVSALDRGTVSERRDILRVSGKYIVDHTGEPFQLKGMGLGGWMVQEGYMLQMESLANPQHEIKNRIEELIGSQDTDMFFQAWRDNHVRRMDITSLASWGFNSVRLPMHYNLFTLPIEDEPVPGNNTWIETGFELIDQLIEWCRQLHDDDDMIMYIILDLHAAPGGQGKDAAISDYDNTKPSLWESSANRDKTVALWRRIAERYANESLIAGYDLINEPNWDLDGNVLLAQLYQEITVAIREVDKNHILFIEGNWFANDFTGLMTPPWDDNMVYSPHKYWTFNDQASIQWVLDLRDQYEIPIYFGETGENSNTWFKEAIELFAEHEIGWAWWPMKKVDSIAGPLSVPKTGEYQTLLDYWRNGGPRPSADFARTTLLQLTNDLKFENTVYQRDVIDAMFRQVQQGGTIPYNRTQEIPGRILVTDFDLGANGEAYYDKDVANYKVSTGTFTAWNQGFSYRNDGVDIEKSEDPESNGYNIGWLSTGEWMQYHVNVTMTATYQIQVRVASDVGGGKFHLKMDGTPITSGIKVSNTGGWQNWQTVILDNVPMDEKDQKMTFYTDSEGFNLSAMTITYSGPSSDAATTFVSGRTVNYQTIHVDINKRIMVNEEGFNVGDFILTVDGVNKAIRAISVEGRTIQIDLVDCLSSQTNVIALSYDGVGLLAMDGTVLESFIDQGITSTLVPMYEIPGKIEAEAFEIQSGITVETTTDQGGGENIGFLDSGDFLDYRVKIMEAGEYTVVYRTAALSETGAVRLSIVDRQPNDATTTITLLHEVSFPPTGDWQSWTNTTATATLLVEGEHFLRREITAPLFNINWFSFVSTTTTTSTGTTTSESGW